MVNFLVVGGAEEDVEADVVAVGEVVEEAMGEVVEEVCPNGVVEVLGVVCRGEACPSGVVGVLGVVCRGEGCPSGVVVGYLVVYLVVYPIGVAHRGGLPVGAYHEICHNQKYNWRNQLQNQPL